MAPNNAYQAYNNSKIMTASPAELTLMLYEGAIKFCNIAIMGVEEKNVEKAHTNIMKVERIIENFRQHWIINMQLQKILIMSINTYRNALQKQI